VLPGISEETVDTFLEGVDVICDALDYFVIRPRMIMYRRAKEMGIPVVLSGPIGFGATHHYFAPDGMSFHEYFHLEDEMEEDELLVLFGAGLAPARLEKTYLQDETLDFETRKVASVSSACLLCTALSTISAVHLLLGRSMFIKAVPYVYAVDFVAGHFEQMLIRRDGTISVAG
jgi:molybdopterin/thiamine biosynthesis adenylyltransferase